LGEVKMLDSLWLWLVWFFDLAIARRKVATDKGENKIINESVKVANLNVYLTLSSALNIASHKATNGKRHGQLQTAHHYS
jgi:hypothetical protein